MNPNEWINDLRKLHAGAQSAELTVRFLFLAMSVAGCALIWHFSTIPTREKKAAVAAGLVHFLFATGIELALCGKVYTYLFSNHLLWGIPFDIQLAWAVLWGTGVCIAWRSVPGVWKSVLVIGVIGATLAMDFGALQSGNVFTPKTPLWWAYDLASLNVLALSSLGFYALILSNKALYFRAGLYGMAYAFVFYLLIPKMVLSFTRSGKDIETILTPSYIAALAVTALPGLLAAIQFATTGDGSPLPLDPTRKLVTNGVYAHVRNPMQLSGLTSAIVWALASGSIYMWVYVIDMIILLQLTRAFEDHELSERFGDTFEHYRSRVRMWLPQTMPYRK